MGEKQGAPDQLDTLQQAQLVPAGAVRLEQRHPLGAALSDVGLQAGAQAVGAPVVDLQPAFGELGGEVTHGRQHQVELLAVPGRGGQLGLRLHQQDPLGAVQGGVVEGELVSQDPGGSAGHTR